jgi:hypothetical protein
MAMRSQIYEWTNLAPSGTGSTLSRNTADTSVAIASGTQVSVFTGGVGYNITKPAETTATQFVVIEDIPTTVGMSKSGLTQPITSRTQMSLRCQEFRELQAHTQEVSAMEQTTC